MTINETVTIPKSGNREQAAQGRIDREVNQILADYALRVEQKPGALLRARLLQSRLRQFHRATWICQSAGQVAFLPIDRARRQRAEVNVGSTKYYREGTLTSDLARSTFVFPDRCASCESCGGNADVESLLLDQG